MNILPLETKDLLSVPYDPNLIAGLSEDQIEAAYRHQLLKYTAMDAKRQLEYCFDLDNDALQLFSSNELLLIADRFLGNYDCNVDDNTAWYTLLRNELKRLLEELQDGSCERPYELILAIVEALDNF